MTLSTFSFSQLRVDGQAIQEKISPKAASARALDLLSGWTAAKKEKEDHTAAVHEFKLSDTKPRTTEASLNTINIVPPNDTPAHYPTL
jgi:hypothetical protein